MQRAQQGQRITELRGLATMVAPDDEDAGQSGFTTPFDEIREVGTIPDELCRQVR